MVEMPIFWSQILRKRSRVWTDCERDNYCSILSSSLELHIEMLSSPSRLPFVQLHLILILQVPSLPSHQGENISQTCKSSLTKILTVTYTILVSYGYQLGWSAISDQWKNSGTSASTSNCYSIVQHVLSICIHRMKHK